MRVSVLPLPQPIQSQGLVILVDILRATSTITAALFHEALAVKPVASVEEALLLKDEGYLVAGERDGLPPKGFDLGNSPREMEKVAGHRVALSTTNGTKALRFVQAAKAIVAGSFLNISAVVRFAQRFEEVHVLCAGTQGELALEDFLWAGKFVQHLLKPELVNDAAVVALAYAQGIEDLKKGLWSSHHAQKLKELGLGEDVEFCARQDIYPVVPLLTPKGFVAIRGLSE